MARCILGILVVLFAHPDGAQPPVPQQPVCPREVLMAAVTLVGLLSTVDPLVSVQMVTLDEPHVTRIAGKWLFPCVCENMSLEVVAAAESSVTVIADEVLLDFQRGVVVHVQMRQQMLHLLFNFVG